MCTVCVLRGGGGVNVCVGGCVYHVHVLERERNSLLMYTLQELNEDFFGIDDDDDDAYENKIPFEDTDSVPFR